MWIVSNINRAVSDKDPWEIIEHCIQDLQGGGECKRINFICTKTDDINPDEYTELEHFYNINILKIKQINNWTSNIFVFVLCIFFRDDWGTNEQINRSKVCYIYIIRLNLLTCYFQVMYFQESVI